MSRSFLGMRADDHCLVDAPPNVVLDRLSAAIQGQKVSGTVRDGHFAVTVPTEPWRVWRPVFRGRLVEVHGGTLVELVVVPDVVVALFLLTLSVPFVGVPWLLAASAFAADVPVALKTLGELMGASAVGRQEVAELQPLADPEQPGAERGAPASLSPWVGPAGVVFAPDGFRLTVSTARLRIDVTGRAGVPVDWAELRGVDVDGTELVLRGAKGALRLPAADVPEAHRRWLARYLEAASRRFGASEQDAARQDDARRRLGQLRDRSSERGGAR